MPCDTRAKRGQTLEQRKAEVRDITNKVMSGILQSRVKIKVSPNGAVAFDGISEGERDGVTDACIYRRIMVSGPATVKAAIERAAQLQGRTINKAVINGGEHSHDGGKTWHSGH